MENLESKETQITKDEELRTFSTGDEFEDSSYSINKFGITMSSSQGNLFGNNESYCRTPDGFIIHYIGSNATGKRNMYKYFDNGCANLGPSIIIHNRYTNTITTDLIEYSRKLDNDTKEIINENIDTEAILKIFDKNSQKVMETHPETIPWYTERRKALVATLERETDPLFIATRKIKELEDENKTLEASNTKLTDMLSKALEFITIIRNHPAGKIFFSSKLKKFDKEKQMLDTREQD